MQPFVNPAAAVTAGVRIATGTAELVSKGTLGQLATWLGLLPRLVPHRGRVNVAVAMAPDGRVVRSFDGRFFNTTLKPSSLPSQQPTFVQTYGPLHVTYRVDGSHCSGSDASTSCTGAVTKTAWHHVGTRLWGLLPLPRLLFSTAVVHTAQNGVSDRWTTEVELRCAGATVCSGVGEMTATAVSFHPLLQHVVLFDGKCVLCNEATEFIRERDPQRGLFPLYKVRATIGPLVWLASLCGCVPT